jgi:hypothetical protein
MATWTTKVLKVLDEYKDKEGVLKNRREIVRLENGEGKHFDPQFQKTSFYLNKDGVQTRGYAQGLNKHDFKWIDEHRKDIDAALAAEWKEEAPVPVAPAGDIEETPF